MQDKDLTISLSTSLLEFIENYKITHQYQSNSQVIKLALELLKRQELEEAYREASAEVDLAWNVTIADGLTDETW